MFIDAEHLRRAISIMQSIDRAELLAACGPLTDETWLQFRGNPFHFYLRTTAPMRQAITNIINLRISRHV